MQHYLYLHGHQLQSMEFLLMTWELVRIDKRCLTLGVLRVFVREIYFF